MSAAAAKTIAEGLNGLAFVACPAAWAEHRTSIDVREVARAGHGAGQQLLAPGHEALRVLEAVCAAGTGDEPAGEQLHLAARAILEVVVPDANTRYPCVIHGADCPWPQPTATRSRSFSTGRPPLENE